MPLIFAVPAILGGYALFTGAYLTKPVVNSTPEAPSKTNIAFYAALALGAYFVYKKVK